MAWAGDAAAFKDANAWAEANAMVAQAITCVCALRHTAHPHHRSKGACKRGCATPRSRQLRRPGLHKSQEQTSASKQSCAPTKSRARHVKRTKEYHSPYSFDVNAPSSGNATPQQGRVRPPGLHPSCKHNTHPPLQRCTLPASCQPCLTLVLRTVAAQ